MVILGFLTEYNVHVETLAWNLTTAVMIMNKFVSQIQ